MALAQIIVATVILTLTSQIGLLEAKKNYDIVFDRMETKESKYMSFEYLRITKYNQTQLVVNASVMLHTDIPDDSVVKVTCYELLPNNQYSPLPVIVPPMSFCDFVEKDTLFYPDLVKAGNLPTKCPFQKGHMYVNNYIMNSEKLPPKVPGDRWRIDVNVVSKYKSVLSVSFFVTIKKI